MPIHLQYLLFDISDDTDGVHCFDALAATRLEHRDRVLQEADCVLTWSRAQFPNGPGPVQEGHDWDFDLQQGEAGQGTAASDWHEISLSITASEAFAQAFIGQFPPNADAD